MRLVVLCIFLVYSCLLLANTAEPGGGLVHDWRQLDVQGKLVLISNHPAPLPFSLNGEPSASLASESSSILGGVTLSAVVEAEIAAIREEIELAEYLEEDGYVPDDGIVSYYEETDGQTVAFIKYRARGVKGGNAALTPRSIRHAILIRDGHVHFVHLVVLFAGHQDEVRADQLKLIKQIIRGQDTAR